MSNKVLMVICIFLSQMASAFYFCLSQQKILNTSSEYARLYKNEQSNKNLNSDNQILTTNLLHCEYLKKNFEFLLNVHLKLNMQFEKNYQVCVAKKDKEKTENEMLKTNLVGCNEELLVLNKTLGAEKEVHLLTNEELQICNSDRTEEKGSSDDELPELLKNENKRLLDYIIAPLLNTPFSDADVFTRYTVACLGLQPLADAEGLIPAFGPVLNDLASFRHPIAIPAYREVDPLSSRSGFIAVRSGTHNINHRNEIRMSWKKHIATTLEEGLVDAIYFAFVLAQTENKELQDAIERRIGRSAM